MSVGDDNPNALELSIFNAYVLEEHRGLFTYSNTAWTADLLHHFVNVSVYEDTIGLWRWYDDHHQELLKGRIGGVFNQGGMGKCWSFDVYLSDPDGILKFQRAIGVLIELDGKCNHEV